MVHRPDSNVQELQNEVEQLRAKLQEAEEVLRAIGSGQVDAIMVTGSEGDQVALILTPPGSTSSQIQPQGNSQYVAKSVNMRDLDNFVRARREGTQTHGDLELGHSPEARQLRQIMEAAAEADSTILLQGETGTGKNVIARWIYEHSRRAGSAFVEINCAGLKGDLLANELFGHEKGAFTSATENKLGLLDVANGGTLFLDEIGDMDLSVQSQFLKVLEEKRYRRLGSVKEEKSEFRLICATNRDLTAETQKGAFRKDLYYRIHVYPIDVPPLRARSSDIPILAASILRALTTSKITLDASAQRLLRTYDWPGNIRELRNVLERALLISRSDHLNSKHFPGLTSTEYTNTGGDSESERIENAMLRAKGNKSKAAELLGMSRVTLYRKLKEIS